ncbi:hypothetical protein BpHYR1_019207 [Brachionus plicatilis]|uniref:Uncharacterized protein n=1 Tax=Brachionus plicatilis TaxID=10195 RepID=A0A3M7REE5_BRAPC|nr:hypothetical protein BpHYR1_019207 [Brachionus plicatilis]
MPLTQPICLKIVISSPFEYVLLRLRLLNNKRNRRKLYKFESSLIIIETFLELSEMFSILDSNHLF